MEDNNPFSLCKEEEEDGKPTFAYEFKLIKDQLFAYGRIFIEENSVFKPKIAYPGYILALVRKSATLSANKLVNVKIASILIVKQPSKHFIVVPLKYSYGASLI